MNVAALYVETGGVYFGMPDGHVARKRTWLYLVGVARSVVRAGMRFGGTVTHWISGFRSTSRPRKYERAGSAVPPGIKVCSAQQRRRTPPLFAAWLVGLAQSSRSTQRDVA